MPSGKKVFLKQFFVLALPIMLQQLSGTILNICDTIMVGKISDKAISAVTVANKTYSIYALFIFGISSGIMMFMSQYYGAGKIKLAKNTLKFGLQVCITIAGVFVLAIVLFPQFFIHIFVKGTEILNLGTDYIRIVETYIPAITVVDNVFDLLNVAFYGCSVASGIVIGKILGTGDMKKAWNTSKRLIAICLTTSITATVLICALSGVLPRFFSLTGSVFTMATTLLIMKAMFGWTQGYSETIYYIIRAGGDVKAVLLIDGLFMIYGPLLMSTIVSYGTDWPIQIVYLCTEATYIIKILVATYFYRRKKWCRNLTE